MLFIIILSVSLLYMLSTIDSNLEFGYFEPVTVSNGYLNFDFICEPVTVSFCCKKK